MWSAGMVLLLSFADLSTTSASLFEMSAGPFVFLCLFGDNSERTGRPGRGIPVVYD